MFCTLSRIRIHNLATSNLLSAKCFSLYKSKILLMRKDLICGDFTVIVFIYFLTYLQGCSFGYHAGGWGKPPVDENGKPLYGDVFGTKGTDFEVCNVF